MPGAARCGEPPPDSRTDERQAQLVSFVVSRVGAGVPLLPSVASQAALYRPSAAAAFRISLILSQLDERLAVGRRGGLPLDLVLGQAEILGDDLRDLDVEALVLAAGLQPEAGLVGLDPDDQLAFLLGLAHHAGFRRAAATGVVALAAARGGGAERQRQTGQQRQSLVASHAHSSLSASVPWTGSPWRARRALLLAAGQLCRVLAGLVGDADPLQ